MKTLNGRFQKFKSALFSELGDKAVLLSDGETVIVLRNEFSPERTFETVQRAIDHFSRFMPKELL